MNIRINRQPQDIDRTIAIMQQSLPAAQKQVKAMAAKLAKAECRPRAIYDHMQATYHYHADPAGVEYIRLPEQSYRDRKKGIDCEDYALMVAAILTTWGMKPKYRVVDFNGDGWSHIYVVVKCPNTAKTFIIDPTHPKFNFEDTYRRKRDFSVEWQGLGMPGLFQSGGLGKAASGIEVRHLIEPNQQERKIIDTIKGFVNKEPKNYGAINGVLFDQKTKEIVATDGMTLLMLKYPEMNASGIFSKKYEVINGRFPDYESVIPDSKSIDMPLSVDVNSLWNYVIEKIAEYQKNEDYPKGLINPANFKKTVNSIITIDLLRLKQLLKFLKNEKVNQFKIQFNNGKNSKMSGILLSFDWNGNKSRILLMPVVGDENFSDSEIIKKNIVWIDDRYDVDIRGLWSFSSSKNQESQSTAQAQRIRLLSLKYKYAK